MIIGCCTTSSPSLPAIFRRPRSGPCGRTNKTLSLQGSPTAINNYRSLRVGSHQSLQWDGRQPDVDSFAASKPPNTLNPDLTLHEGLHEMTNIASMTAPVLNDGCSSQGVSPLFQAAVLGNVKILSIMVHNSIYPEMVNQDGQTILHIAAKHGHCDEVEFLLGCGFDVNARDNVGNTALHLAISNGWEKMVEVLVAAGADVDGLN